jgi:hypothetical protein
MKYKVCDVIDLLQRFPQNAFLVDNHGLMDLRVAVPNEIGTYCDYYKLETPDDQLPWLLRSDRGTQTS